VTAVCILLAICLLTVTAAGIAAEVDSRKQADARRVAEVRNAELERSVVEWTAKATNENKLRMRLKQKTNALEDELALADSKAGAPAGDARARNRVLQAWNDADLIDDLEPDADPAGSGPVSDGAVERVDAHAALHSADRAEVLG
jgi:hypothetical protein